MQRESLLGWWIKVRRRLPVAAVCVAVGVLLIAETALGQRTRRRMIPACTSPEFAPRIVPSPVRVPVGGTRTVTTAMLCDREFPSSFEFLKLWLVDDDEFFGTVRSNLLGVLMSSDSDETDTPVRWDQLAPLFNAIKRKLAYPEDNPEIFGTNRRGELSTSMGSREGRPPSCVEPILPTAPDTFGRADLTVHLVLAEGSVARIFFPRNIPGNPRSQLTVQACCFLRGDPPEEPPSTALDPIPAATQLAFRDLGELLGASGDSPPPEPYQDSGGLGGVGNENLNAQAEVKQDKANHKDFIEMLRKLGLAITVALSNLFGVSAAGAPNAQEVIGTVTVAGPFPWVEVSGDLMDDGTFVAEGKGTVAGFPNIAVRLEGTLTPGGPGRGLHHGRGRRAAPRRTHYLQRRGSSGRVG